MELGTVFPQLLEIEYQNEIIYGRMKKNILKKKMSKMFQK
jgi:hypothetical protein